MCLLDLPAGTNGGAGYCEGDGDPTSLGLTIYQSSFLGNSAQLGGGFYASTLCNATIIATGFEGNLAREYGGAILAGSSSLVDISFSTFTNNGNFDCFLPPLVSVTAIQCIMLGWLKWLTTKARFQHRDCQICKQIKIVVLLACNC